MSIETIPTSNRAERRAAGRHRRRSTAHTATALTVAAAALVSGIALAPAAFADPIQGGVTGGDIQGGVTGGDIQGGTTTPTPAPTPAPQPTVEQQEQPQQRQYWVAPPQEYNNTQWRALPDYNYNTNTYTPSKHTDDGPVQVQHLHLPTPVAPTAPIVAPRNKIRLGEVMFDQPNWVSNDDAARTNNTAAVIEAGVSTFWRSTGMKADRADRMAAAEVAGGATGAMAGAAAAGIPAAVAGGLIGGTIGGITGATAGGFILTPIPGLPAVTTGVAGTAGGAAIGAAVAGIPAAAAGAVAGGAAGVVAGSNFGAGDLAQPRDVKVPDVDQKAVTTDTENTLTSWKQSGPVGQAAAQAVHDGVQQAAAIDTQARAFVATQPGGKQVLDQVNHTLDGVFHNTTPGLAGNLISTAVGNAITGHHK